MAKNTLQSFVSATRQMLTAQLFITVAAVGLAGWTAAVTNNIIRERNELAQQVLDLKAQVHQLGGEVAQGGPAIAPPPVTTTTATPPAETSSPATTAPVETTEPGKPPSPATATTQTTTTATTAPFDPSAIISALLPPPKLHLVVLHVHSDAERASAERVVREMGDSGLQVTIDVLPRTDTHPPAYAYFDARQSRPAQEIAQRIQLAARRAEISAWAASLSGFSLPASAEYTVDRVDFVLPPLPSAAPPSHVHITPGMLEHMEHLPPAAPAAPVLH